jgi:hypothetical protein
MNKPIILDQKIYDSFNNLKHDIEIVKIVVLQLLRLSAYPLSLKIMSNILLNENVTNNKFFTLSYLLRISLFELINEEKVDISCSMYDIFAFFELIEDNE